MLPLIRISNGTITTRYYRRFKKRFTTFVPGNAYPFHQLISSKSVRFSFYHGRSLLLMQYVRKGYSFLNTEIRVLPFDSNHLSLFLILRKSSAIGGLRQRGTTVQRSIALTDAVNPPGLANAIIILISMVFNKGAHCVACTGSRPTLEPAIQTCMR